MTKHPDEPNRICLSDLEAMCADPIMQALMIFCDNGFDMREILEAHADEPVDPNNPDWVAAGLNCQDWSMILPVCMMAYLTGRKE